MTYGHVIRMDEEDRQRVSYRTHMVEAEPWMDLMKLRTSKIKETNVEGSGETFSSTNGRGQEFLTYTSDT